MFGINFSTRQRNTNDSPHPIRVNNIDVITYFMFMKDFPPNTWSPRRGVVDGQLLTVLDTRQNAEDRRISLFELLHESGIRPCEAAIHEISETQICVLVEMYWNEPPSSSESDGIDLDYLAKLTANGYAVYDEDINNYPD